MAANAFIPILRSKGFVLGDSGRWLSPDVKYNDYGVVVEVQGANAVAVWRGGRTLFEGGNKRDMEKFMEEVV